MLSMLCAGTTYSEFIRMMHLPSQLAHVDPIVASFCGGAVGVLSAFMVVEANNAKAQEKRRCQYCEVRRSSLCIAHSRREGGWMGVGGGKGRPASVSGSSTD